MIITIDSIRLPARPNTYLQLFAAGGLGVHQSLSAPLHFHVVEAGAPFYVLRWFFDVTKDGLTGQALGGCARVYASGVVTLHEWNGEVAGTVVVSGLLPRRRQPTPAAAASLSPAIPAAIEAAMTKAGARSRETFASFKVDDHWHAPVTLFALHARRLAGQVTAAEAHPLLHHLERWARALHPPERPPRDDDLLASLLAVPTLAWAYRFDETLAGKSVDQWSVIGSFPQPHRAAFDCDDGAHFSLELFHVLYAHGVGPLADLARQYKPYLAVGEIKGTDKHYGAHLFLLLLPLAAGLSVITVESTAVASGAWHEDLSAATDADKAELVGARGELKDAGLSEDNARIHSPLSLVDSYHMYGRVYALFDEASYLACVDKATGAFGPQASKFFRAPRTTTMWAGVTPAEGLQRMPRSRLLEPPQATAAVPPPGVRSLAVGKPTRLHTVPYEVLKGAFLYGRSL
jgi:hypothetical protein